MLIYKYFLIFKNKNKHRLIETIYKDMASDRSLSFFTSIPRTPDSAGIDQTTGMIQTTESVEITVNRYDPNNTLELQSSEQQTANYNVVKSIIAENEYINYMGNASTNDYVPYNPGADELNQSSLSQIIAWSQQNHPSMKLGWSHFAFLKDFGTKPTNRLMILRRFNSPVLHNLFETKISPKYTMATYYSFDDDFLNITFNEEWEKFTDSITQVLTDVIGVDISQGSQMLPGSVSRIGEALGSTLNQTIITNIAQSLGYAVDNSSIYGDPNIIYESIIRKIADDDSVGGSLKCDIGLTFKVHYTMKEINGIDAKAAMMDLISNATHMATSNGKFLLTSRSNDTLAPIIKAFEKGDINGLIDTILDGLSGILQDIGNKLSQVKDQFQQTSQANGGGIQGAATAALNIASEFVSDILKTKFQRYKWKIQGAVGAMTGSHTAPWHITIGNPKNPWFSMGNLYIESCTVDNPQETELSWQDFPTEWVFTYKLKNGRAMGANEITSLFNGGRGRVYSTIDKIQSINLSSNAQYSTPGNNVGQNGINPTTKQTGQSAVINDNNRVDTSQINDPTSSGIGNTSFNLNTIDNDNNLRPTI